MAVPPKLSFSRLGKGAQSIEVYLDPLCPFSAKIARSVNANVLPLLQPGGKYDGKLHLVARIYPQSFHYFSHYVTEAVLIVGQKYPDAFWDYLLAVFDVQKEWFNVPSQSITASTARDSLIKLAVAVLKDKGRIQGPESKVFGELRDGLEVREGKDGSINGGNEVVDNFKATIKIGRQNGIHVTPTVLFDGLKEDSVSSSWEKEEWEKFLGDKLKA